MTYVIRFSGNAASNLREAMRLLSVLNQYLPMLTQLINNGLDHWSAWQRVLQTFNAQHGQNAQLHQNAPSVARTPVYWYAWDQYSGRLRVATYGSNGAPVWASQ
jgi:hypothetical protein